MKSDYKLGLCIGIGSQSLSNYRGGKTLPDEKACMKLAAAMGEDPAVLTVEMQAKRAKNAETRKLWEGIALRLQKGLLNVQILLADAIIFIAVIALPVWAALYFLSLFVRGICILC